MIKLLKPLMLCSFFAFVETASGGGIMAAAALADVQGSQPLVVRERPPLYFHSYTPVINSNFQLQPGQGFSIIEPFGGFTRMVQVCVRDVRSSGPMPVPTPALVTRVMRGETSVSGVIPVGSCALLEGEQIAVGIADGSVDTDTSESNIRQQISYISGTYTIRGYYSRIPPQKPVTVMPPE